MKGMKTGGRQKGSQNKVTVMSKNIINQVLADYVNIGQMSKDWKKLDAKDRVAMAEKLMNYVLPKMQSIAADMNLSSDKLTLEHALVDLSKPKSGT